MYYLFLIYDENICLKIFTVNLSEFVLKLRQAFKFYAFLLGTFNIRVGKFEK